jgi:hypothetical protein
MNHDALDAAQHLIRCGYQIHPSGKHWTQEARDLATDDIDMLDCFIRVDPSCCFRVRTGRDIGLLVLQAPRMVDLDVLVREWGPLPPTLAVSRFSGPIQRWFRIETIDPDIVQGLYLLDTRAFFKRSAPVPLSVCPHTGERYEILGGGEFNLQSLHRLPDSWLEGLPRNGMGITATTTRRDEYVPPNGSWS